MTPPKRALAWTAAALYGLPALLGAVAGDLATGDTPRVGAEREHFLIEWVGAMPHPAADYDGPRALEAAVRAGAVGLASRVCREVDGGRQLELDVAFPLEDVRLMAVERLDAESPRLVWREIAAGQGRTVFAEWTAASERLKVMEWGLDGSLRESHGTVRGAVMPQYLLDLARRGRLVGGRYPVFDPTSGDLETWSVELSYRLGAGDGEDLRRLELRRTDGSLAGRYDFVGTRLVRFQWQEGSLVARAIPAAEYRELRRRWGLSDREEGPPGAAGAVKDL